MVEIERSGGVSGERREGHGVDGGAELGCYNLSQLEHVGLRVSWGEVCREGGEVPRGEEGAMGRRGKRRTEFRETWCRLEVWGNERGRCGAGEGRRMRG